MIVHVYMSVKLKKFKIFIFLETFAFEKKAFELEHCIAFYSKVQPTYE